MNYKVKIFRCTKYTMSLRCRILKVFYKCVVRFKSFNKKSNIKKNGAIDCELHLHNILYPCKKTFNIHVKL